ncbi:glycosyltransferase family 4 protein [Echinicola soli]|uniref:Glycosyltransferase family 4 protein n=1 Tax=Echinicola soli TaxID=2591634 RepID=A0A514CN61_9BACT|nr:glycosyltransferase family 4 protein [Echinicola soli]QDH81241.1 glycosyltransferase family 4 protein [Echinicola soli]
MRDKKTIWIINQDATTPETGYAGRSYYLSEELSKLGHKVYLIAGGFSHLHFNSPEVKKAFDVRKVSTFNFVWLKLPSYANAHSKKRILNWFLFAFKISRLIKQLSHKPDVVIYSSPPLIGFLGALYIKIRSKAKLVFEIRDIWPLTLKEIGGFESYNPLILLMSLIEKLAYRKSDFVISNLSNAYKYLKRFNIDKKKFLWIPNGISLNELSKCTPLDDCVNNLIPKDKFVIGYSGTLGAANAMEFFIEASKRLRNNKRIFFVIVGTGKEKENLKSLVMGNENVIFLDPIPKEQIYSLLQRFDVCYIGWRNHKLYDYGIGANKLPEYLCSKKPIIHSYSGKKDIVKLAKAGISLPSESVEELVKAFDSVSKYQQDYLDELGRNGYEYAMQNLTYKSLAPKLINSIYSNL